MKILHVCLACFYIDNYSYQENLLPKYHKQLGFEVSILASLSSFDSNGESCVLTNESTYINSDNIKVIRINYLRSIYKIARVVRLYENTFQSIKNEKPDIIFIHGCQFLDINQIVKYVKINPSVRVYFDNHADFFNSASNWVSRNILHKIIWRDCAKKILPYTKMIYGVSPARNDFLINIYGMPKEKVKLLPMGADVNLFKNSNRNNIRLRIREKLKLNNEDFVIISGGKIDSRKNINLLIESVNKINNDNIKLIVFGNPTNDVIKEFNQLINGNNIRYVGWLDSKDVYDYFFASDLAVFPGTHSTLWEEAVGCGMPCVFKKWSGITHLDVGGNCEYINDITIEEITNIISRIYNNKEYYKKMKKNAIEKGIDAFSYQNIAKRSIEVF